MIPIHSRVENSLTLRLWKLQLSPLSVPPSSPSGCSGPRVVGRTGLGPIMSHNPRWVRLSRGGGGRVHRWCRVSPVADIPCYPKRRAVIPQDLPRAGCNEGTTWGGARRPRGAARRRGGRGGGGGPVLGLTGGEGINRIASPRLARKFAIKFEITTKFPPILEQTREYILCD